MHAIDLPISIENPHRAPTHLQTHQLDHQPPLGPSPRTLRDALLARAHNHADPTWIGLYEQTGRYTTLSLASLATAATATATALRRHGLRPRDRILIALEDRLELIHTLFAALLLGAVPVPISVPATNATPHEIRDWQSALTHRAVLIDASITVTEPRLTLFAKAALTSHATSALSPADLSAPAEPLDDIDIDPGREAYIQFSAGGGTGILVTHDAAIEAAHAIDQTLDVKRGDLIISWHPLHHPTGLSAILVYTVLLGIPSVILSPHELVEDSTRLLWAIHDTGATIAIAPHLAYAACVERYNPTSLEGLDLSSLRAAFVSGDFIHAHTLHRFHEHHQYYGFRLAAFHPTYAVAESALALTSKRQGEEPRLDTIRRAALSLERRAVPARPGEDAWTLVSAGRPLPGLQLQIIDDTGLPLPERVEGEIVVSGPGLDHHRICSLDAPSSRFTRGGLYTGDLGYLDGGELFVTGRKHDILHIDGPRYHPDAIEAAAERAPGVRPGSVVAFAAKGRGFGAKLVVAVETDLRGPFARRRLRQKVRAEIRKDFGITTDEVVLLPMGALPRAPGGHARRREAAARYARGELHKARGLGDGALAEAALTLEAHATIAIADVSKKARRALSS